MTEFKIYDCASDEMVPLTQERLDQIAYIALMFGYYRQILNGLALAKPMKDGKPNPAYRDMMRKLSSVVAEGK